MQDLATKYRKKLDVQVVGITGSNGKTTTKDIAVSYTHLEMLNMEDILVQI